jgi:hypothetical protein
MNKKYWIFLIIELLTVVFSWAFFKVEKSMCYYQNSKIGCYQEYSSIKLVIFVLFCASLVAIFLWIIHTAILFFKKSGVNK